MPAAVKPNIPARRDRIYPLRCLSISNWSELTQKPSSQGLSLRGGGSVPDVAISFHACTQEPNEIPTVALLPRNDSSVHRGRMYPAPTIPRTSRGEMLQNFSRFSIFLIKLYAPEFSCFLHRNMIQFRLRYYGFSMAFLSENQKENPMKGADLCFHPPMSGGRF